MTLASEDTDDHDDHDDHDDILPVAMFYVHDFHDILQLCHGAQSSDGGAGRYRAELSGWCQADQIGDG